MIKLDIKDKKILFELDKNARQPLSKISKKVKLSREAVLYRINKYKKEGLIRDFLTVIDVSQFGFTHYKVYIKLQNTNSEKEKEFIQYLSKNPFVSWISSCDGEYSLIYGIKTKSLKQLKKIMQEINNKYWKIIRDQDITTIISANHFYRNYLTESKEDNKREIEWGEKETKANLDKTNIEILNYLSKNTRINSAEIAYNLKISADAVIKRIKKLEKSNIITHYMIWPDVNKLIGSYNKVLLSFHNLNSEKENKLHNYCLNNPNIIYTVNTLGKWQFEMDIESKDIIKFRKTIKDFINNFSEIISNYTTLNIYEEYKFRFFEKAILS